ncbi:MAG: ATP-binding protein, partial [Coriobacteriales bacterium]|nr:ATP-binding protein [Coriobacteriales bacterium]
MSGVELDSLFGGESDRIEYKATRPRDARKYLKTVVAFANGHGARIVFGVDDKSREVVGVPPEDVFDEMDAIANAIGDACTPTIIPSIYVREAAGKSLIIVDVASGRRPPYYIRSLGLEGGVYTRVGATSRPADLDYVREIMAENSPQGFDRMPNRGVELAEEDIATLCARMKEVALSHSHTGSSREAVRDVTESQLLKWGVLVRRDGKVLPTNAYSLLTGEGCDFTWQVQCGVFRGEDRVVFLDRREFGGSVIDQVEQAYQYVLSKINLGANFDQLVRQDVYEIPMWPIRELITNAVLHRSYLAASSVQVCLYDDRLEISSPGGLKRGLRLEDALAGQSEIRNKALALAFQYMKLIENWGTGLRRVRREVTEFGLRDPEFVVSDNMFRVNIYRMSLEDFGEKLHPTTVLANKAVSDNTNPCEQINE